MTEQTYTCTVLTAAEGMILTNGEIYGTQIYLGENDSSFNYHEITVAEYEEAQNDGMQN